MYYKKSIATMGQKSPFHLNLWGGALRAPPRACDDISEPGPDRVKGVKNIFFLLGTWSLKMLLIIYWSCFILIKTKYYLVSIGMIDNTDESKTS